MQAITSLRQAIEQAEKQEPVAWMWRCKPYCDWPNWSVSLKRPADSGRDGHERTEGYEDIPLYTTPQPQQAEKQEPVAWATAVGSYAHISWGKDRPDYPIRYEVPLYTTPQPKREWVGLTQQDIDIAFDDTQEGGGFNEFARAIEQILRRKNT